MTAVSFWFTQIPPPAPRLPLQGDVAADVAIIGAGYTGLWTAYYLKRARPDLVVRVVEKRFAGYGASGRNGGWLTGGMAWDPERYAATHGTGPVRDFIAAMRDTVPEVIRAARAEGIAADIHETDEVTFATTAPQLARITADHAERRAWGEDVQLLDAAQATARVRIPGTLGAILTPGVARVQPAKLVTGLAQAVDRLGVHIHEATTVTAIAPGRVTTDRGTVRAGTVLRCTEGYTADLPGHRRDWLPLNSAQVVTAPLPDALWQETGWQGRELLGDFANSYCYCQRTRDGRIALGGRGIPYRFGSRTDTGGQVDPGTLAWLLARLYRHFPALRGHPLDHAWCGVLGVPRDWCATVGFDPGTRIGFAGGYVGVGVATSNLAGRTLADLTLGRDTGLTRLPWVNHRVRSWEPEPLRWLGVRGMYAALKAADRAEADGRPGPSSLARLAARVMGRG